MIATCGWRALRAQAFGAGWRSQDRRVHHVAIENFVPREIEIDRAGHKDVALASFAQRSRSSRSCGVGDLEDDAPALGTANALLLQQGIHAHQQAVGVGAQQVHQPAVFAATARSRRPEACLPSSVVMPSSDCTKLV